VVEIPFFPSESDEGSMKGLPTRVIVDPAMGVLPQCDEVGRAALSTAIQPPFIDGAEAAHSASWPTSFGKNRPSVA